MTSHFQQHVFILIGLILLSGCTDEDHPVDCTPTVVNEDQFYNAASNEFDIAEITIANNGCLEISVTYGGGCGQASAILVDSGEIFEADPAQRDVRLLFTDNDECEALIKKNFYFNIDNLKIEDDNKVLLNFQNTDSTFLYEY